jgi:hypothetical protein
MCNTAAVVVDRVLPEVPVRQWVLSAPFDMRLLLVRNAEAFGELTRIFTEEVLSQYRRRAAKLGILNTEGGALVFQHRFGGSLNLNTYLHAVLGDGVFEKKVASDGTERIKFHVLPPQHPVELTAVAYDVYRKFVAWLRKKGLMRLAARPALSMERMSETSDGLIAYRLRHTQKGKATYRVMRPIDLLARIAAIIPPPRHPLLRYFGVFGPHSSWRRLCVPAGVDYSQTAQASSTSHSPDSEATRPDVDRIKVSSNRQRATSKVAARVSGCMRSLRYGLMSRAMMATLLSALPLSPSAPAKSCPQHATPLFTAAQ